MTWPNRNWIASERRVPGGDQGGQGAELSVLQADQDLQNDHGPAAGQIKTAQALLQRIPKQGLDANLSVSVNTLRVKIDTIVKQWESAIRYLRRLPGEASGVTAETLCDAAAAIRDDLYVEGLDRLEPFLSLAEQADRARAANREPAQRAEELLALAVTGWLLGKEQAEKKPEVAAKLWTARQFAMEYLATQNSKVRSRLLEQYKKMTRSIRKNSPASWPRSRRPNPRRKSHSTHCSAGRGRSMDEARQVRNPPPHEYRPQPTLPALGGNAPQGRAAAGRTDGSATTV